MASGNLPLTPPQSGQLDQLIESAQREFALPDEARRALACGDLHRSEPERLIRSFSGDADFSQRLLRWCQSSWLAHRQPMASLEAALQRLDRAELTGLALLAYARRFYEGRDRLWAHSIAVGAVASLVARTCGRIDPDLLFVAGALHDIGLCAHQRLSPHTYDAVLADVDELSAAHEVEREQWGWDHTELGAAILRQWGLPPELVAAAQFHHAADLDPRGPHTPTVVGVAIANYLCSRAGWSAIGFHNLIVPEPALLASLGVDAPRLTLIWQQLAASLASVSELR